MQLLHTVHTFLVWQALLFSFDIEAKEVLRISKAAHRDRRCWND